MNDCLTYADAARLHELQDWTVLDAQWFTAGSSRLWKLGEGQFRSSPLPDPTLSMLYRYFLEYPDECFVPKMSKPMDVYLKIHQIYGDEFSARKFGVLAGCNPFTGYAWTQKGATVSETVLRVISLIDRAVTFRGQTGLDDVIRIVLAEATSRSIPEDRLWSSGWGNDDDGNNDNSAAGITARVDSGIMDVARRVCGLSVIDTLWTGGTINRNERTTYGNGRDSLVKNPTVAILWRYLAEYPQDHLLPPMPVPNDIAQALESVMAKNLRGGKYCKRRVSQLLGCTGMGGYNWLAGSEGMSGIVKRLGLALVNAIVVDGRGGFDRYLDVVEREARSRGINGLDDLFRNEWKTWNRRRSNVDP